MSGAPALAVPHDAPRDRQAPAIAAVLTALALVVLDAAMINVSLPTIAGEMGATPAQSVRLVSFYQAAVVMALLPCAAISESLGSRRVFLGGLAFFTVASLLAAFAPSLSWLAAARFGQGLGAAAVMALGVALLREALPDARMGSAIGWNALTVGLCSAAGPALGGMIVSMTSWRWLFVALLPLALAALLAGRALPASTPSRSALSWGSMALSAGSFGLLILGLERLAEQPALAAALLVVALLCFSILCLRERPKPAPLIPIDLLREPIVLRSVLVSICCFAGQTAGLLALPFLLQARGESMLTTGLSISPWPAAAAAAALASNRLARRFEPTRLCTAGAALLASGMAGAALLPPDAAALPLALCAILCGTGFGLFQAPNNRVMLFAAPLARSAAAGGLQGTARLLGQAGGAVAVTSLFALAPPEHGPNLGLCAGAAFAAGAAAISAARAGRCNHGASGE